MQVQPGVISRVGVDVADDELVQGALQVLEGRARLRLLGHAQGRQHLRRPHFRRASAAAVTADGTLTLNPSHTALEGTASACHRMR